MSHVLDAASNRQVIGAESDSAGHVGDGGHRTSTHAVDGISGNGLGESGKKSRTAADRQALISSLSGRRDGNFIEAFLRNLGVSLQKSDHRLDDEVISSGIPEHALLSGTSKWSTDSIYEYNLGFLGHNASTKSLDVALIISGRV